MVILPRSIIIFLLLIGASFPVEGQVKPKKDRSPWSFGVNGYYGAICRYRGGTPLLNFTHPYGVEVYANIQTLGKRLWERQYKLPQLGFAFSHYDYGIPQELGKAYSVTGYIDNVLSKRKKSSFRLNLGTGLVYSTRYYKPIENEFNKAIGSQIAFALRGTLRYEVQLQDQLFLNFNLAFRHFSNGGLNKPNNGMNFPLLGLGIRYQRNELEPVYNSPDAESNKKGEGVRFNLKVATGRKEVLLVDKKHPVYSIVFYASKKITPINAILLGADGIWDSSIRNEYINISLPPPEGDIDPRRAGLTLGHELYIGDVSFVLQLGKYLYEPHHLFHSFYQRYGLLYYVTKNISASAMLVVHTRSADFIEFGMGIHL